MDYGQTGDDLVANGQLAESTLNLYRTLRTRKPSPRVRQAMRLYETAAVPSKKAAAEAVGLSAGALYQATMPSNGNSDVREFKEELDATLDDRTIDMSRVLAMLSRKAIGKIHTLMTNSQNEHIQLKAATDLADRAPDTSKTQKLSVSTISMTSEDAKQLATAMVESAKARTKFAHVAKGDFVQIEVGVIKELPAHAERMEKKETAPDASD